MQAHCGRHKGKINNIGSIFDKLSNWKGEGEREKGSSQLVFARRVEGEKQDAHRSSLGGNCQDLKGI